MTNDSYLQKRRLSRTKENWIIQQKRIILVTKHGIKTSEKNTLTQNHLETELSLLNIQEKEKKLIQDKWKEQTNAT